MTPDQKTEVMQILVAAIEVRYPMRWTDEQTSMGDFSGRDSTVEVFNILTQEQLPFLRSVRDARQQIRSRYDVTVAFIFHSPKATAEYYGHLGLERTT